MELCLVGGIGPRGPPLNRRDSQLIPIGHENRAKDHRLHRDERGRLYRPEGLFDTKVANYVFSRKHRRRAAPGVEFVSEPVKAFAQRLRATPGKQIWMMGGGALIASFLDAGEIDEFDIHVIPVFIGKGIPLVAPRHRDVPLRLLSSRKYPDGVVRLHYEVVR